MIFLQIAKKLAGIAGAISGEIFHAIIKRFERREVRGFERKNW